MGALLIVLGILGLVGVLDLRWGDRSAQQHWPVGGATLRRRAVTNR